jgi:hypothetical protein
VSSLIAIFLAQPEAVERCQIAGRQPSADLQPSYLRQDEAYEF